jgi:hypothetical protein
MSFVDKICYSFSIFTWTILGITFIPDLIPKQAPKAQPESPTRKAEHVKLANMCNEAGVATEVKRDYNTGETSIRVPRGTYYTTIDAKHEHTSRRVVLDYGYEYPAIFDDDKATSCGYVNLDLLKKQAIPFTQLDPSIYQAEESINTQTKGKYTFIKVKNGKPSMIYIAFIDGQTPTVVCNNNGCGSISNFGNLNRVRIASFDVKE